ncbi:MAG: RND transporter [SAR324 cluster bacterium]|nr:RND transporter [SAR324 cluster bacterium]
MNWIANLNWSMVIFLCLTIGLAPFSPPHIWEKLQMLLAGDLKRMIDWFDLLLHGSPWVLLLLKIAVFALGKGRSIN